MRLRFLVPLALAAALGVESAAVAQPFVLASRTADGSLSVIDLATQAAVSDLPLPGLPAGIAVDTAAGRIFVADAAGGSLVRIDAATGARASVLVGAGAAGVALRGDGTVAFVSNSGDGTVSAVDTAAMTVLATVPVGANPTGIAADGGRFYVANLGDDSLTIANAASFAVVATVAVGHKPLGVAARADGSRVFVSSPIDDRVSVVDPSTASVLATIDVGRHPQGITLSPDGSRAYVANLDGPSLSVLDGTSGAVLGTVPLGSPGPFATFVSADGARVLVAHAAAAAFTVVDAATLTQTATLPASGAHVAIAGAVPALPVGGELPIPTLSSLGAAALAVLLLLAAWRRLGRWRAALLLPWLSLLGLFTAMPAASGTITVSDGEFVLSSWSTPFVELLPPDAPGGSHTETRELSGGDPGAFRRSTMVTPQGFEGLGSTFVVHIFGDTMIDPAATGPISNLAFTWRERFVFTVGSSNVSSGPAVLQNGNLYLHAVASPTSASPIWGGRGGGGPATSFDLLGPGAGSPDFSILGTPFRVGYWVRAQSTSGLSSTVLFDVDQLAATADVAGPCTGEPDGTIGFSSALYLPNGSADTWDVRLLREGGSAPGSAVVHVEGGSDINVVWETGGSLSIPIAIGSSFPGAPLLERALDVQITSGCAGFAAGRDTAILVMPENQNTPWLLLQQALLALLSSLGGWSGVLLALPLLYLLVRSRSRSSAKSRPQTAP